MVLIVRHRCTLLQSVGRMDGLSVVSQWCGHWRSKSSTYVLCNFDASGDYYVKAKRIRRTISVRLHQITVHCDL